MLMTVQDPAEPSPRGQYSKQTLSIWTREGRSSITTDMYMNLVETFKPDIYLALCDGDTDIESSNKRVEKATEKSRMFLEKCLQRHEKSAVIKNTSILGAVEGGYCLKLREKCIKHLLQKSLFGFVIDGLHHNGPDVEKIDIEQVQPVIKHSLVILYFSFSDFNNN